MHRIIRCIPFILIFFLAGCAGFGGDNDPYSKRYSAGEINANPAILDGTFIKGSNLDGLRLENITLRNTTIMQTTSKGAHLKNVVFDNCRFINAVFDQAVLENVTFRGGLITCVNEPDDLTTQSKFTNSTFHNLVLDGTNLENALFEGKGGTISFHNIYNARSIHPIVQGKDFQLTLDKSIFRYLDIANVTGNSSVQGTDCTFEYARFGNSVFNKVSFTRCLSYGGAVYGGQQPRKAPASGRRPR